MARRALSAERALQILELLAAHPGRDFTLAELVRESDINISSLHAVLAVLTREGYIVRDPRRKAYQLGAGPIALGQAALDEHPAIKLARHKIEELARDLQLEVICGTVAGEHLLIAGEAGRADRLYMRPRVGTRLPFMPPLALLAIPYLDQKQQQAWLGRLGPNATQQDRDNYMQAATLAGQRGYTVELETPTRGQIGMLMGALAQDPRSTELNTQLQELVLQLGHEEHTLTQLEPDRTYNVNNIQTPIFDHRAQLVTGLILLGYDQPLTTHQINDYLHTLRNTANAITRTTGGHPPN
ncbi:MAG TPA: helix-turn-helix domain-containing protein [Solirubrobacteraceae bacterium]|nr:helix-turn-helix domain-containing protein [Solirubrobacteraceae bacterium]